MRNTVLAALLAVVSSVPSAVAEIVESDLFVFGDLEKYKTEVVSMLNTLAREHSACRQRIDHMTAGISKDKSVPGNPSFFVQCGDKDVPEVVRFTLEDIRAGNVPAPVKPIDRKRGMEICRNAAELRGAIPPGEVLPSALRTGYDPKPNGNAVLSVVFRAHGVRVFCFFEGRRLADITVKPYSP